MPKYFPINTETSCKLQWSWSSVYLNQGTTSSCCRAAKSAIPEDFNSFHNTPVKIQHRELMLQGLWPGNGCEYCSVTEQSGGLSERQFQNSIPNAYPKELDTDPALTSVRPAILEVFFNNTCNLGCVYCNSGFSSTIQAEDKKFGGPKLLYNQYNADVEQTKNLTEKFWSWFESNCQHLERLHILGGEPFLQKDMALLIDFFDRNPQPLLEFNLVTNLSLDIKNLSPTLDKLFQIKQQNKLSRIELHASIDSWNHSQEYVRHGLKLENFDRNMQYILDQQCFRVGLLSTVTSLTIHGMPELSKQRNIWSKKQPVYWYLNMVLPYGSSVLDPTVFDFEIFESSFDQTRKSLPSDSWDDKQTLDMFDGLVSKLKQQCKNDPVRQQELLNFLKINDQRRATSWQQNFPWLVDIFRKNHVV